MVDRGYTYRRFFADVQMYTDGPSIDPQQYLSGWSCGHIQQRENNWANGNNSRACNETYDQALAQLPRTMIGPERDQLVQRFRDCSQTPKSAEVMVNAQPGATVSGICPGGGIVRRRNKRDLPFLYCALGVPRISRRGRAL